MRFISSALIAGSLLAAAGTARAEAPTSTIIERASTSNIIERAAPRTLGWIGSSARLDGQPGDLMQVIPSVPQPAATGTAWVLYLNKNGGTFTPGDNDSRTNSSSVPQQTSQIPAWSVSATGWTTVVNCIKDEFSAYNITVTDVDPGSTPHIEAVIAGSAANLGLPSNVGGVSPFTVDCGTIPNSIVYAFAESYGTQYQTVCEVAAQEIAHSFGLDHEVLASDPMTYLSYNGHKTFQNTTAQCGETSGPRACGLVTQGYPSCRADQNSVALLSARIGVAGTGTGDTVAPTASITAPTNGASVRPGFTISVSATDNVAVTKVELLIDNALVDTKTAAPFSFTAPASIVSGNHKIDIRAYDANNMSTSSVSVTVSAGGGGGGGSGGGTGGGGSDDGGYVVGGCSSGGGSPGMAIALGIMMGLWLRRRHARTR